MRILIASLLISAAALGQSPANVVTFNRADAEHCKVIVIDGKPLLETTYDGTSVAIAMPVNRGTGEFLIFVAISHERSGSARINPKDIYGIYSDPAHTRFTFYDEAAQTPSMNHGPAGDPGMSATNAQIDPGSIRPGQVGAGAPPPGGASPGAGAPGEAVGGHPPLPATFLRRSKIKKGDKVAGWVALRPAKGAHVEVHATNMLDEIDIPVNGVIFRF